MREQLLTDLIRGDRVVWGLYGVLWLLAVVLVVLRRSASAGDGDHASPLRALPLLAAASAIAIAALPLSAAIAVPRVRWRTVDAPDLAAPAGETWRKLRGPVVMISGSQPDLAVPAIDAQDRWVLAGLLSGRAVEALPPAPDVPAAPGAVRICRAEGDRCRAWPSVWPDPGRAPATSELAWSRVAPPDGPLAYDVELEQYLAGVEPPPGAAPGAPAIELLGRVTSDAPRDATAVLFAVYRVAGGRLRATRMVAVPAAAGHAFHVQQADVSLEAGPRALRWFARPALRMTSLALPVGAAALLAAVLRGRGRVSRSASANLEMAGAFAAGVAAAAPAVVAMASLWGSR